MSWRPAPSEQTSRWLSREFAELLADPTKCHPRPVPQPAYDLLVIGSGYGGAIAAAGLAGSTDATGRRISVCVLERGREFLPGAFPSRLSDLPTQLRGRFGPKSKGGEGLFDIRTGRDISVLVANGLGGGSLINAGVMEVPQREMFDARWPTALRQRHALDQDYLDAQELLGARHGEHDNHIGRHVQLRERSLAKTRVLSRMGGAQFRRAAITVAMQDRETVEGVGLKACKLCGDCATGCNYGAKESLDTNLLVRAYRRGADIYCGATALRLQRPEGSQDLWSVEVAHTEEKLRLQDSAPRWITARRIVLAAGTLGSSEILLRSQRADSSLSFSSWLGQRFSGNGDLIAFGYDYGPDARANAVADEHQPPAQRRVGPTITGIVDSVAGMPRMVVEELAVPGILRRAAEESITTANTMHALGEMDRSRHRAGHPAADPFAVDRGRIRDMSIFAAMGDDGAGGSLKLGESAATDSDGQVEVVWPGAGKLSLFETQMQRIDGLAKDAGFGGRTVPNPVWRFLPDSMEFLVNNARGPLVTVHPLGGVPMGDTAAQGVVDDCGRVFDSTRMGSASPWYEGLVVLDGAILPGPVATNPALTIAAVALRAVRLLRQAWHWQSFVEDGAPASSQRPQVADVEADIVARSREPDTGTVVGVTERLAGPMRLRDAQGQPRDCWVELTLTYDPLRLSNLFMPDEQGRLSKAQLTVGEGGASSGQLRVFLLDEWQKLQRLALPASERLREETRAARSFRLGGSLTIMLREDSTALQRTARGLWAWVRNRGLRDTVQSLLEGAQRMRRGEPSSGPGLLERIRGVFPLASRAGEARLFEYQLQLGAEIPPKRALGAQPRPRFEPPEGYRGGRILGHKRITYARPSNPWRQLQELQLDEFCGSLQGPRLLTLDAGYLAARGRPLLRIEAQRDHVEALVDFVSLAGYFLRLLLTIHIWNLRKPDTPRQRPIQRLPGSLPGLPEPEIHWLDVDDYRGEPVRLRLARYRGATAAADALPVLLIHGYSASGTTYAHPALKPGLAPHLAQAGRDVWVADLRSSAGLSTATVPWTFEQVALADIPAAIDYIWSCTGQRPLDVVAHCMGAVMLSQAILSANKTAAEVTRLLRPRDASTETPVDRYRVAREALPQRIRRVVLSQNGPVMVMSQQNIFRGYVMSYLEQMFGPLRYDFRPEPGQGLGMELFDRFLGSLPYPDAELKQENPWQPWRRTEYLATRHRMDALYGRTFTLGDLDREVLDYIDDLFGPLNLDTVAQVIHFSQCQSITDRGGRNRFVSEESLQALWTFPTLALHGEHNGLADVATLYRAEAVLKGAGCAVDIEVLEDVGHQDSLIGRKAGQICARILQFLEAAPEQLPQPSPEQARKLEFTAEAPWLGPMLSRRPDGSLVMALGASPQLGRPSALCLLPVERDEQGHWSCLRLMDDLDLGPEHTMLPVGEEDSDWQARALPAWADGQRVRQLLVLPVYPQPACMAQLAFDPGDTNVTLRLRKRRSHRHAMSWRDEDTAPAPQNAQESRQQAMAEAVARALGELNRLPPREQMGLLKLPEPDTAVAESLTLALGSCQYPPGIVNELPGYRSWERLARRLDHADRESRPLQLLVLTGDQIYADATAGLFDPTLADDRYRKPYETWLRQRSVRRVLGRLPMVSMLDDHELDDNWAPLAPSAPEQAQQRNRMLVERGVRNFLRYQRPQAPGTPPTAASSLWMQFKAQGIPVFMADTRTQRSGRTAESAQADAGALLGGPQWNELRSWLLAAPRDLPKLIVSPAVLLPRHRYAAPAALAFGGHDRCLRATRRSDGWDGYPETLLSLLDLIVEEQIRGVVFLSGDEHLGLFTSVSLRRGDKEVLLHSIHAPGLNTPYRFANAETSELILDETLQVRSTTAQGGELDYRCTINSRTFEEAGFALVSLQRQAGGDWQLLCEFDGEEGAATAAQRSCKATLKFG